MPYYNREKYHCLYCSESFNYDEDAVHHEHYYCPKSPYVNEAWNESILNPQNRHCATCEKSASFLSKYGDYDEGPATIDCPQRLNWENRRSFPCPAYARCRHVPAAGIGGGTREFPEIAQRYCRSFGL
jgi:hypothetical protein